MKGSLIEKMGRKERDDEGGTPGVEHTMELLSNFIANLTEKGHSCLPFSHEPSCHHLSNPH